MRAFVEPGSGVRLGSGVGEKALPLKQGQGFFGNIIITDIEICYLTCYTPLMSEAAGALTREKILEAAEEVLRRFGPSKATVVDVARALGVSHGSVYRHFAGKAELRDAVVEIWLARMNGPLEAIAAEDASVADRLHRWLKKLIGLKRRRLFDDPELFAAYCELAGEARAVVGQHIEYLTAAMTQMIREGVAQGEFEAADPAAAARGVLVATSPFHNPASSAEWTRPDIDTLFDEVWAIILRGLRSNQ